MSKEADRARNLHHFQDLKEEEVRKNRRLCATTTQRDHRTAQGKIRRQKKSQWDEIFSGLSNAYNESLLSTHQLFQLKPRQWR